MSVSQNQNNAVSMMLQNQNKDCDWQVKSYFVVHWLFKFTVTLIGRPLPDARTDPDHMILPFAMCVRVCRSVDAMKGYWVFVSTFL